MLCDIETSKYYVKVVSFTISVTDYKKCGLFGNNRCLLKDFYLPWNLSNSVETVRLSPPQLSNSLSVFGFLPEGLYDFLKSCIKKKIRIRVDPKNNNL